MAKVSVAVRTVLPYVLALVGVAVQAPAHAQPGTVIAQQKISSLAGGFAGPLQDFDAFGFSVANLGDLDADGITDIAVGERGDDDGGTGRGAVWILFLNSDGTVKASQKISDLAGGFGGVLDNDDVFGTSVSGLGDLDGDGIPDLAVGATGDDDGASNNGALWILFLKNDGTVKAEQKISDLDGGFGGTLNGTGFGRSVAPVGDLNADTVVDLVVGNSGDSDGGVSRGAVWILFMNSDGTVNAEQKISDTAGGFNGTLDNIALFGTSVTGLGDLDEDAVPDIVVGAAFADDGGSDRGQVWVLFLNSNGTVKDEQKISDTAGGIGPIDDFDQFGISVAALGDLDDDGVADLAVGVHQDDDGGPNRGAVRLLFLNTDGTVKAESKISQTAGGFGGTLADGDNFGEGTVALGDLNDDGGLDLAVGAQSDEDGGPNRGATWILFLEVPVGCQASPRQDCIAAQKGSLAINEKAAGKEKLKAALKSLAPTVGQNDFGDPVSGTTRYDLCLYDDADVLIGEMTVDRAGATCATKACWKAISTKGFKYKDAATTADGIAAMTLKGGGPGKGGATVKGKNAAPAATNLPVGLAAALAANTQATVQLLTDDASCFGVTLTNVKTADGVAFKALVP